MYKRTNDFIEKYSILYPQQFGFRSKHSTTHALINITEKIRFALDQNKVLCGIFIYLQKASDTVNHKILLYKLNYYGFRGVENDWLRSYLHKGNKRSVLIAMNLNLKLCIVVFHKVAYLPTFIFVFVRIMKKLQKQVNRDLKSLHQWLLSNKITLK